MNCSDQSEQVEAQDRKCCQCQANIGGVVLRRRIEIRPSIDAMPHSFLPRALQAELLLWTRMMALRSANARTESHSRI